MPKLFQRLKLGRLAAGAVSWLLLQHPPAQSQPQAAATSQMAQTGQ